MNPVYIPVLIKFDKASLQYGSKSIKIPHRLDKDLLDSVYNWLAKPFYQEWFKDCTVIWIEGIGEVEMPISDFIKIG